MNLLLINAGLIQLPVFFGGWNKKLPERNTHRPCSCILHNFTQVIEISIVLPISSIALYQNVAIDYLAINEQTFVTFHSAMTGL